MLLLTCIAILLEIPADNTSSIIDMSGRKSAFVLLTKRRCKSCGELRDIWKEIGASREDVVMGHVSCDINGRICQELEDFSYPRMYWFDRRDGRPIRYYGDADRGYVSMYIRKRLEGDLVTLKDENDVSEYIALADNVTSVLFELEDGDKIGLEMARFAANEHREGSSMMLLRKGQERRLTAFVGHGLRMEFSGVWNSVELSKFIGKYSVPFGTIFRSSVMKELERVEQLCLAIVTKESVPLYGDNEKIARRAVLDVPVVRVSCSENSWFCGYTSVKVDEDETQYVVFDRHARIFWVYEDTDKSADAIITWMRNSVSGEVKARGPGLGLIGQFLAPYFSGLAVGDPYPFKVYIPPAAGIISVFVLIWYNWSDDLCQHSKIE